MEEEEDRLQVLGSAVVTGGQAGSTMVRCKRQEPIGLLTKWETKSRKVRSYHVLPQD